MTIGKDISRWRKEGSKYSKCCKGCIVKTRELYCVLIKYGAIDVCPCSHCLVKIMCNAQAYCQIRLKCIHKHRDKLIAMHPHIFETPYDRGLDK